MVTSPSNSKSYCSSQWFTRYDLRILLSVFRLAGLLKNPIQLVNLDRSFLIGQFQILKVGAFFPSSRIAAAAQQAASCSFGAMDSAEYLQTMF